MIISFFVIVFTQMTMNDVHELIINIHDHYMSSLMAIRVKESFTSRAPSCR